MDRVNFFKIGLLIIVILVISLIGIKILKKDNIIEETKQNGKNYLEAEDGTKTNISEIIKETQKIDDVLIEDAGLIYKNSETILKTKVTNNSGIVKTIKFKIYFNDESGNKIEESFGYVGNIAPNETRVLETSITTDVSNSKSIKYEISK